MAKGSMSTIVGFVLLAVGILLFIPFIGDFGNLFAKSTDSTACSVSLLSGEGKANCPVKEVKITQEAVLVDGKEILKKDPKIQSMGQEGTARLLLDCLNLGGGYNSRAFSRENYFSDEIVCIECYEISFETNVEDITAYLNTAKKPISDKTYLQLLTRDDEHLKAYMDFGSAFKLVPGDNTLQLEKDKPYTIFFMGRKKGETPNIISKIGDIATGSFLKLFFENNDVYFSYVTETEKIGEICNRKVN